MNNKLENDNSNESINNENSNMNNENSNSNNSNSKNSNSKNSNMNNLSNLFNNNLDEENFNFNNNISNFNLEFKIELENMLLKQLPFSKQNDLFYQKNVLKKVNTIIELNNNAKIDDNFNNNYYKNNCLNLNFPSFIKPISSNKKRIYKDIKEESDSNNENSTEKYICDDCNQEGIYFKSNIIENNMINDIENNFKLNTITFYEYNNFINNLQEESYIVKDENGYNTKIKKDILSLRYYDINSINYNFYKHLANMCYEINENDKLFKSCYFNSKKININGFLIQKNLDNQLYESYYDNTNFSKINEITKISINKNCVITCKDHNLQKGDYLLIQNSELPINGVYSTTLNIIDKDNFTLDIDSTNFKIDLKLGELYGKVKLNIDTKNYENAHKLVLFNDSKIEKEDYINIINKNIPNDEEIYLKKLNNINNLSELFFLHNNILNNNINNNNYEKIILKINEKINNILSDKLNFSNLKINNKNIDIDDFIFSDELFYSDIIVENYGNYYLKGKKEDKNSIRLNWINQQIDNGNFYYLFILKHIYENNIIKVLKINTDIYKKELEELEKKLNKYEDTCHIYKVDSLDEIKDPKEGQIAIITSDNDDLGKIYIYYKKWEFVKVDKSKTMEEICLFDLDSNIKNKKITCEFVEEQCVNRIKYHLKDKYNKTKILYDKLLNVLDKNTIISNINKEYDFAFKKLKLLNYKYIEKNIISNNTSEGKTNNIEIKIIQDILSLSDKNKADLLLFDIISKDGITIDNKIYSKKFQLPIICSHWNYLRKIYYTTDLKERNNLQNQLYEEFVDEENEGYLGCKYCGAIFNLVDYDEIDGFTSEGHIKTQRTEIKNDVTLAVKSKEKFKVNCSNEKIQDLLIKYKFDMGNFKNFSSICDIVKFLCDRLNIELREDDYLKILIETNEHINNIEPYDRFKKVQMIKLARKGMQSQIQKYEKLNIFKNEYKKYYSLQKYSIVLGLLLLFIQYSSPNYKIIHPKTNCHLNSIDEYDGVNFVACILKESQILNIETVISGKKKIIQIPEENIVKVLTEKYNEYIKLPYIQELIKESNKNKKVNISKTNIQNVKYKSNVKDSPNKLPKNFDEYLLGKKGKVSKNDYNTYFKRTQYLSKEIINIINHIVKNNLNDFGCCLKTTDSSFSEFIRSKDKNIGNYLDELEYYNKFKDLFAYKANYTILKPKARVTDYYHIPFNITQNIMNNTIKYYNYNNDHSGKRRIYKKLYNNKYDIISGRFENDIKNDKITEEDYYKLLENIQDLNTKKFIKPTYQNYDKYYDNLKDQDYIQKINNFVDKITHYLQKDKEFSNEFKEKLKNLGLFYEELDNEDDNRKIIFNKNNYYIHSIKLIKSYINDYFRKYINLIKNKFQNKMLPTLDDFDDKQDYIKELIEDNQFFKEFYEYNVIFKNIEFDYTYDEINNFNGSSDRYDSQFNKVKSKSKYDYQNISEMLKFILFDFLTKMLYEKGESEMNNKSISGERTNIILSQFIYKIFEKIEFDNNKLFISQNDLNNFHQALIYQNSQVSTKFGIGGKVLLSEIHGETDDEKLKEKIDDFKEAQKEKYQELMEKAKESAKKDGKELDAQELEDIVDEMAYEEKVDAEEMDEYDITQPLEIDEILDVGDDYGAEDQSMETAGSGITQAQFDLEMEEYNNK